MIESMQYFIDKFQMFPSLTEFLEYESNKIATNLDFLIKQLSTNFEKEKKHESLTNIFAWTQYRNYFKDRMKRLF